MSKEKKLVAGGAVFLIIAITAVSALLSQGRQEEPLVQPLIQTQSESAEPLLYKDEAGFSFKYPPALGVVEQATDDSTTYSSLELSSKDYPNERLLIKITDTSFKSIDDWLTKNPQGRKIINFSGISLGGMQGKSFKYDDTKKNLVLAADSGILYFLESPADGGFWDLAFQTVVSSFQLTQGGVPSPAAVGASNSSGAVIDEGEEIIE